MKEESVGTKFLLLSIVDQLVGVAYMLWGEYESRVLHW